MSDVAKAPLTETKYAKHEFTTAEIMRIGQDLAQAEAKKRERQDTLKSVSSSIKAEIDAEDAVMHKCGEKIRSGYEMRPHECKVEYLADDMKVRYIDVETGEIIEERLMSKEEQMKLSLGKGE